MFEEHQGQGYATEAASALRDWIFRETDAPRFLGFADVRNAPSLAVLGKVGMVKTHVETEPNGLLCQFHVYERPKNG
jgi:RimJ/RimL family protein N-acetyltransferase